MKARDRWEALIAVAIVLVAFPAFDAKANFEVSAGVEIHDRADFYGPLGGSGVWVDVGSYGRCWRPAHVEAGWRPYCNGTWVWTDCGWYWESDEPWAWACYHYGGWVDDPSNGWVWVPDVDWGPSWVCWREGGGYVGWAPLPPHRFRGDVIVAADINVQPSLFVFVEANHFHDRFRPSTVIVNNTTIVNRTTNITKISRVDKTITNVGSRKVVVNEGPSVANIEKATGTKVRSEPIHQVVQRSQPPAELKRNEPRKTEQPTPTPQPREKTAPDQREKAVPQEKAPARENVQPRNVQPQPRERTEPAPQPREKAQPAPQPRERTEPAPRERPEPREKAEPAPAPREKAEPAPRERAEPAPREGGEPKDNKKGE